MSNFASRVIQSRTDKGWSPEELAEKAGMSLDAIEHIESGKVRIGRNYPQLATALEVDVEWLATGREINSSSTFKAFAHTKDKKFPPPNSLGERLNSALANRGIGQTELARSLGINPSTISQLIAGRNNNSRKIDAIAQALGVSARWLRTGKEDEDPVTLEKKAIKQRLLDAIECLPIEQLEHVASIVEALGQAQKTEPVKIKPDEISQRHPLLQSNNTVVKRRKPPEQGRIKKAS